MPPDYTLSQIFIYPIKSLGGIAVTQATVDLRGLQYDRRWLLVDENGRFLTQRTFPEMALLQVSLHPNGLVVKHKHKNLRTLFIPFVPATHYYLPVQIWDDLVEAVEVSPEATHWFTAALGRFCRLVYMPETGQRQTDLDYANPGEWVSFADSFPILIIGQSSLDDLNKRLENPVPINRFRPNLVFTGGLPFGEDYWQKFRIGELDFKGIKPCARCVVTTIDQETIRKSAEPLRTLATYRTPLGTNKVNFGLNVTPVTWNKIIQTGDKIEVLETSSGN
jgi:uncharacterized protein